MKKVIFLFGVMLITGQLAAQQYFRSAGLRLGHTSGFTYKQFLHGENAVEFMLSGRNRGIQFGAAFVHHTPMLFSFDDHFYAYFGAGAHIGTEKYTTYDERIYRPGTFPAYYNRQQYFTVGLDGLIGIEYRFLSIPMTVSIDVKPYLNLVGMSHASAFFWDAGITAKYIF